MNDLIHSVRGILLVQYQLFAGLPPAADLLHALDSKPCSEKQLEALDILLLQDCGIVLSPRLRNQMRGYSAAELSFFKDWVIKTYQAAEILPTDEMNTDPLNACFPDNVPDNMHELWESRFLSLFQETDGNCLNCGAANTTHLLNPCHHVVCSQCFHGYTGCPICGQPIDADSPFLIAAESQASATPDTAARYSARFIDFCPDMADFARNQLCSFCSMPGALSPQMAEEIDVYIDEYAHRLTEWLPKKINNREVKARIFAQIMKSEDQNSARALADKYLTTATDVLRLIHVMSGEDGSLTLKEKSITVPMDKALKSRRLSETERKSLMEALQNNYKLGRYYTLNYSTRRFKVAHFTRLQRRFFLEQLEKLDRISLIDDMLRHRDLWVYVGEYLHPGEYKNRYPQVQEAFKILRKKAPDGTKAPKYRTWNSQLQKAIDENNGAELELLLLLHPGEFARHLDEAIRKFGCKSEQSAPLGTRLSALGKQLFSQIRSGKSSEIKSTLQSASKELLGSLNSIETFSGKLSFLTQFIAHLKRLNTATLFQLYSHLGTRTKPLPVRQFIPAGHTRRVFWKPDSRATISRLYSIPIRQQIETVILSQLEQQSQFETAIVDDSLKTVLMPYSVRGDDNQNSVTSGSFIEIPCDEELKIRLFLHWCRTAESEILSDLDLSVGFFNEEWQLIEECTYYNLSGKFGKHSGDFQDAPWPRGASEYVDIDRAEAQKQGIRYVAALVNVYHGVDFSQLCRAYTGLMFRKDLNAEAFDPQTVKFKYPLTGVAGSNIPFIIDLATNRLLSLNINSSSEQYQNLSTLKQMIAINGRNSFDYYSASPHGSRYEMALFHAASRAKTVYIRRENKYYKFSRADNESIYSFYIRIRKLPSTSTNQEPDFEDPVLAFLRDGDMNLPDGSETYVVFPGKTANTSSWNQLTIRNA